MNDKQKECAEKLYRQAEKVFFQLIKMSAFDDPGEREKFFESMDGRIFGESVLVFKSKVNLLYLRIGNHNLGPDYEPARCHIEKIGEFLSGFGRNWRRVAGEINRQLAAVMETARICRRNALYPEFGKLEAKIAKLEKRIQEKDKQLRLSLEVWAILASEIDSSIRRANSRIYAMFNEIGKSD